MAACALRFYRPHLQTVSAAVFLCSVCAPSIWALQNCEVRHSNQQAHRLVVLAHGIANTQHRMDNVRDAITVAMPDADLLAPTYSNSIYASDDPRTIAWDLASCINSVDSPQYSDVVLVGYSAGGLLLRKAFLLSRGYASDDPNNLPVREQSWGRKVSRIVLLAGMNRGWSIDPPPEQMRWIDVIKARLADALTPDSIGGLIRSMRRGSPFVVDLRIDWMRMAEEAREAQTHLPLTIQLLGDQDDVVARTDSIDLESGVAFVYKRLPDPSNHMNAVDFTGDVGELRKKIFLDALTTPPSHLVGDYRKEGALNPDFGVTDVVFVVHGIRDPGPDWTKKIAQQLEQMRPRTLKAIPSSYDYFPMGKFLLGFEREKNVRWMMDQYTAAMANYPRAKFSFIGHSNGTFLLAQALRNYPACRFERAALAGSVIPTRYPWHQTGGKISSVRNYVATADYVVGIFPHLYELLAPNSSDIGGAGFLGFDGDAEIRKEQVTWVVGGHDAALQPGVIPNILAFIVREANEIPISPASRGDSQSKVATLASRLCWLIWLALLLIVVGAAWFVLRLTRNRRWYVRLGAVALYLTLLIILLDTI